MNNELKSGQTVICTPKGKEGIVGVIMKYIHEGFFLVKTKANMILAHEIDMDVVRNEKE